MTRIIMHGCNGHMGQVITGIVANDANAQIVAGIDLRDDGHNLYPVFASLEECNVEADVIIDFASAKAEDTLVDYIKKVTRISNFRKWISLRYLDSIVR